MATKSCNRSEIGVSVKDVSLHYSGNSKPTLVDMNMNIPKGAIYGLLGPSGCGKTSILRCILGRNRPKSGDIRVFGFRPGTKESQIPGPGVGYMPQDIALYNEFSIEETINYFATIFSLSHEVKKSRLQNLLKFLDLPDKNRLVKNLSGGQKRRVSMAATLVHKPKLLILDEPTVGVDPLLRESIWQHLYELTQAEKMTIIITTHYIEEARLAHVIGLMRQGTLLVEENPQSLMLRYACTNLEEVFLKICHLQKQPEVQIEHESSSFESNNNNNNNNHDRPSEDEHHPLVDPIDSLTVNSHHHHHHHHQSYSAPVALFTSDVESINGNVSTESNTNSLLKQEILQQRLLNIYNDTTYRKQKNSSWSSIVPQFKVFRERNNGHVNFCLDHFNKGCSQVRKSIVKTQRNLGLITFQLLLPTITMIFFCLCIGNSPTGLNLAVYNEEVNLYNYSHDFINKLDPKVFNLHFYSSEEEAIESVREGSNWGALIVNANYSYGLKDRLENFYQISNDSLASSIIKYYSDQTEMPIQLAIGKGLLSAGLDYVGTVMQKILPEIQPEVISSPMFERMPPIYGQLDPSFRDYVAPALVLAVTYAMSVGLTALAFVQERKEGLFERSLVSGVNTVHIFFAHFIVEFCMVLIQTLVMLFFMFVVFKVPIYGSVWLAVALTLAQGMCGMSFGMLISSICQDERNAIMLTIGMFYPTLVLTGIIWPIEAMPKHMLYFVLPLPQTLSVKAMRAIITKAWDFWHPEVNFGFASTFAWILIFNMAALIIFSRR